MPTETPIVILTVKEVAEYLQVHPSTIYKLIRQGQLPAVKIGADWRFNKGKIDEWTKAKST